MQLLILWFLLLSFIDETQVVHQALKMLVQNAHPRPSQYRKYLVNMDERI